MVALICVALLAGFGCALIILGVIVRLIWWRTGISPDDPDMRAARISITIGVLLLITAVLSSLLMYII